MTRTEDDLNLQSRLRADDKNALERIYKKYRSEFIAYGMRYDIGETDILDIYQDSIISMHQNFVKSKLELKTASIKTYLFGIGKNKIFKTLKTKQRFKTINDEREEYQEIDLASQEPSPQQLVLASRLNQISESCRSILKMFYYRNLTIDEIVELTDYKDGNTVRSHKSRCIKRLKTMFETV
ncbi:MAG: sigma-70 family RNA polymerase sigma factor [Bacteroidota bacterium]